MNLIAVPRTTIDMAFERVLRLVVLAAALVAPLHSAQAAEVAKPPNAEVFARLTNGGVVRRSSLDNTWTAEDRSRLRALGLDRLDGGAVVLRYIPKVDAAKQLGRLRTLARFVQGFAPSGLCDSLSTEGESKGLCVGTSDGPLGKALVRLPFAADLREDDAGVTHFSIWNTRPLEAKALFSWTKLVAPSRLRFAVDLYPADGGWYVYTRIAVEMSAHTSAAKDLVQQFAKLDAWLSHEIAQR